MRTKIALLVLSVFLICVGQAGAALVNFTGDVDADFAALEGAGDPRFVPRPDNVGDIQDPSGGCGDEPLGQNSFKFPPPDLSLIPPSGFNIERVVTVYDCTTDTLYVGLDVCDGKIAWDIDGNGNKLTFNPAIVPGFELKDLFTDTYREFYRVDLDVNPTAPWAVDLGILVDSLDGGTTITTTTGPLPPGVVVDTAVTGPDVELVIHGLRAAFPPPSPPGQASLPVRIQTSSGGPGDFVNEDATDALFDLPCTTCLTITKKVSCSPTGPFIDASVTPLKVLRGAPVYFQIQVTNCSTATDNLKNVVITDTWLNAGGALLACTGCTNTASCIPGTINVGNLAVGATATFVCTVPTNSLLAANLISPDATNTASVTGVGVISGVTVSAGPAIAKVDVLVPSITCSKLVDDDSNFNVDPGDTTPPTNDLNLANLSPGIKQAWYKFSVTNNGETAIDFTAPGATCPKFSDDFIKPGGTTVQLQQPCGTGSYLIPGTNQDLSALFLAQIPTVGGKKILAAGQTVSIFPLPVSFDETKLCCTQSVFTDTFTACGKATSTDAAICLPAGAGESVNTGECKATVRICGPDICITKKASCSPTGPFLDTSVTTPLTALRGSTVYFEIVVTNCGGVALKDIVVTDTKTDLNGALLACTGCTNTAACIPGVINIPTLGVGESKTFVCTVPTNPLFSTIGISPDATNTAAITAAKVASSGVSLTDLPSASASVNVVIPGITCLKLVDDDSNTDPAQVGDLTPPTNDLLLNHDDGLGIEQAWYRFCITNTGEVDASFAPGSTQNCPSITDTFIKPGGTTIQKLQSCGGGSVLIPGTNADLLALFKAQLTNNVLPAGQTVCITVGPVIFDESQLCCTQNVFPDTFTACAIAKQTGWCGEQNVNTGECKAKVTICPPPHIDITKEVSCKPTTDFGPSVTALRGATVYFKITVTNSGGRNLANVTITDTLTEVDNALLACTGCTNGLSCIPSVTNVGNLIVGETKTFICTVPTNPNFSVIGNSFDGRNKARVSSATVVNPGPGDPATVSTDWAEATVDVRVPGIECELLMDDDSNFADDPSDLTPPAVNLNLSTNGPPKVEQVWKKLTVCNTGEVDVDFTAGADPNCPDFKDELLESFGIDVAQEFRDALVAGFGSPVLPPGQCVSKVFGPLAFDETVLCPNTPMITNRFAACGFATKVGICLPPAGGEKVDTGWCQGTIMFCEPGLFQAYPGNSNGLNMHYMGHLGNSGETISAVPGVFVLVPGQNWSNFVSAAQVHEPYTLKNVSLVKETPEFMQCTDVFPPIKIQQQGTAGIRLRWPLMYEAPGTKWTLTIQYGTNTLFDDDGPLGPNIPSYYHENVWEWEVKATLDSMKLLLELFHEVPFGTDEVPLISDEVLYPLLQEKLDNLIDLVADENLVDASLLLGDFEMEVTDACIAVSPRLPFPTGPGLGIANSEENPACCKLLIDAEYVGLKLGILQPSK